MERARVLRHRLAVPSVITAALLLRLAVGSGSYSGAGRPPLHGDYEAQRHWMEVTLHTPIQHWYQDSKLNDLSYWGLDYPPLTAYQSWLYGKVIALFEQEAVALGTSRGHETAKSKALMRCSVVAIDLLIFLPAVLACLRIFGRRLQPEHRLLTLAVALMQPAAVLIDHGHFQYNNLSLGLTAGAAAAVAGGWHVLGSVLFCAALNHKQMAAYYAPAFFAHLLGCCLQKPTLSGKVGLLARLGLAVLATCAVIWAPFLDCADSAAAVLTRLVPLKRGLFEDYVANFWCASSLLIKWKRLLSLQAQVQMCTAVTLAACLPSMTHQLLRPSPHGLLLGMANSAFAFFLFSFQVHEKSVLLPLLPITLLAAQEQKLALWLPAVSTFSMWPLLRKDGLAPAYAACLLLWAAVALLWSAQSNECLQTNAEFNAASQQGKIAKSVEQQQGRNARAMLGCCRWRSLLAGVVGISAATAVAIHVFQAVILPPYTLPFLYDALIVVLSFVHLASAALWLNWQQWHANEPGHVKQA